MRLDYKDSLYKFKNASKLTLKEASHLIEELAVEKKIYAIEDREIYQNVIKAIKIAEVNDSADIVILFYRTMSDLDRAYNLLKVHGYISLDDASEYVWIEV